MGGHPPACQWLLRIAVIGASDWGGNSLNMTVN
jgi:hypothetical protein